MVYYDDDVSGGSAQLGEKLEAVLKLVSLFGFALIFGGYLIVRNVLSPTVAKTKITSSFGKIEYVTPYKNTLYENFGFVQEPKVELPMKTTSGYKNTLFLLDSGAVVSALPLQAAIDTGVNLATAKRITLKGFSGVPTFAYLDEITVKIGNKDFSFPAVFTESQTTTYILGRKGFFDDFSIEFDSQSRSITIKGKE